MEMLEFLSLRLVSIRALSDYIISAEAYQTIFFFQ